MLKVAPPILLREAARKGEPVKLVELLEHGADPNATTGKVREGCEVVVRSWWWQEREGRSQSPAYR